MTRKELKELRQAHQNEFLSKDEDEFRQAIREMNKFIDMMVEEGFTRQEAILFVATTCKPH